MATGAVLDQVLLRWMTIKGPGPGALAVLYTTAAAGRLSMALGFSYTRTLAHQAPAHPALQRLPSVSSQRGVSWSWEIVLVSLRESMDFSLKKRLAAKEGGEET